MSPNPSTIERDESGMKVIHKHIIGGTPYHGSIHRYVTRECIALMTAVQNEQIVFWESHNVSAPPATLEILVSFTGIGADTGDHKYLGTVSQMNLVYHLYWRISE
jgi:hypothetical protein